MKEKNLFLLLKFKNAHRLGNSIDLIRLLVIGVLGINFLIFLKLKKIINLE